MEIDLIEQSRLVEEMRGVIPNLISGVDQIFLGVDIDLERLRDLKRTIHTWKGALGAETIGLEPASELAHKMEDVFLAATSGVIFPDEAAKKILDGLEGLLYVSNCIHEGEFIDDMQFEDLLTSLTLPPSSLEIDVLSQDGLISVANVISTTFQEDYFTSSATWEAFNDTIKVFPILYSALAKGELDLNKIPSGSTELIRSALELSVCLDGINFAAESFLEAFDKFVDLNLSGQNESTNMAFRIAQKELLPLRSAVVAPNPYMVFRKTKSYFICGKNISGPFSALTDISLVSYNKLMARHYEKMWFAADCIKGELEQDNLHTQSRGEQVYEQLNIILAIIFEHKRQKYHFVKEEDYNELQWAVAQIHAQLDEEAEPEIESQKTPSVIIEGQQITEDEKPEILVLERSLVDKALGCAKELFEKAPMILEEQAHKVGETAQQFKEVLEGLKNGRDLETNIQLLQALQTNLEGIAQRSGEDTQVLYKISTEVYQNSQNLTTVPSDRICEAIKQRVLSAANHLKKPVNVVIDTGEFVLDYRVFDALMIAFGHIANNAIDHGIESTYERIGKGKPEQGQITIRARAGGSISVTDDGRGISPESIRKKAVEKGIRSVDEVKYLTDEDAIQLIFEPGFSTKSKVTDTSGRGVGMDAAKAALSQVNWEITVNSEPEIGTTFIINEAFDDF